jgi:predicted acylesterase/phospholipase RssA
MKRRPRTGNSKAIESNKPLTSSENKIGLVLSGGGARAAYQVGALKALIPYLSKDSNNINVIIGSSIGAINGLLLGACLKEGMMSSIIQLEEVWRERTFRNTFRGSPSAAFLRAIRTAVMQYMSPGPSPTSDAIFDPTPLMERVDQVITSRGGLSPEDRATHLEAIAVMTTVEGSKDTGRRPLLFLSSHKELSTEQMQGASFEVYYFKTLTAKHGFASAALPSVLPPVELDTDHGQVRLVDGGISQNVPIDPAARLGAEKIIAIDISGRDWWLNRYGEEHDKRPDWELEAGSDTFCLRPPETFILRPQQPLGPILKDSVKSSTRKFMSAVGPIWPVFTLLKNKLGEEVAYETMTYAALDQDYLSGIMERGYQETMAKLKGHEEPTYETKKKIENNLASSNNLNC